jgi:teichuronic acid biosynthesis glycosyltransferase TuaC
VNRGVVLYTQEYPTPNDPTDGLFTQQLADELGPLIPTTVVCPMPWWPDWSVLRRYSSWVPSSGVPLMIRRGDVEVYYPKVPLIPYFSRVVQPLVQALRALSLLRRLQRQGRLSVLNAHSIYPDGVAAALLARWLKVPLVLTAIGSDINTNLRRPLRRRQIKWAVRQAAAVVGVSADLCDKIRTFNLRTPVHRIPNGVDRTLFFPPSPSPRSADPALGCSVDSRPVVLFVGRLHPIKGLTYLLGALGQLKQAGRLQFRTVVVGEGSLYASLRRQSSALGLDDDLQWLGALAHEEVARWLRSARVLCLPSLNEGMPNVVIEAQTCGVPVVATKVGGLAELVSDDSGILVPPADPSALAEALAVAVRRRWDRHKIAAQVSWADWGHTAAAYLQLIESCGSARG